MSRVSKKEEAIKAKYEKLSQEAKPKPKYIKNIMMKKKPKKKINQSLKKNVKLMKNQ